MTNYDDDYFAFKKENPHLTQYDYNRQLWEKAEKYDQLTEQLGCPVEVVMKALKQDYIYTGKNQTQISISLYLDDAGDVAFDGEYKLKDYQKTWWLKRDKTE